MSALCISALVKPIGLFQWYFIANSHNTGQLTTSHMATVDKLITCLEHMTLVEQGWTHHSVLVSLSFSFLQT